MDAYVVPLFVVGIIAVAGLVAYLNKVRIDAARERFSNDPDVEVLPGWTMQVATRSHLRQGIAKAAGGGKNNPQRWDVNVDASGMKGLTTLELGREGILSGFAQMIGFSDIQVGDADFDKQFKLSGNNKEIIPTLFSEAAKSAVRELFAYHVWKFEIDGAGRAKARIARRGLDELEGKDVLLKVLAVVDALEQNAQLLKTG